MHATEYLSKSTAKTGPVVVLYGAERYLKLKSLAQLSRSILGEEHEGLGLTRFSGDETDLTTVMNELRTISMFGSRRLVLVEDAEDFVKEHRAALEKYLEKPSKKSVLVLDLKSFPSTTRLYKRVDEVGLRLDCSVLKLPQLLKWVSEHAEFAYGKRISRDAAEALVHLRGLDLGPLDQELAKLASYAGNLPQIDREAVEKLVGGWKSETTWNMLDNLLDGRLDVALHLLDKLITAGEPPIKLLGSIQFVFRPLARANEGTRRGQPLSAALTDAGVKPFNMARAQSYMRRVGAPHSEQIYRYLLTADRDLKGASQLPEKVVMEKLLYMLSGR